MLTYLSFALSWMLAATFWSDPFSHPMFPVYIVIGFVFLVAILVAIVCVYVARVFLLLSRHAAQEQAQRSGVVYVAKPSWWSRFSQQMNASVPLEQEHAIELDHNYDGIKELDNHLPPWWKWLFYGTIGWSAVYLIIFHVSNVFPLQEGEYEHELALANEQIRLYRAMQPKVSIDEDKLAFSPDSVAIIAKGKMIFTNNNCASCHGNDGGGNAIGPNLTDPYWIHGGHVKNVYSVIKNGAVEKGMPAWGKGLSAEQVRDVTFYVLSLQGTHPQNPKAPQGELYQEVALKSDTVMVRASL